MIAQNSSPEPAEFKMARRSDIAMKHDELAAILPALAASPLVTGLSDAQIQALAEIAEVRQYADGDPIIKEGTSSDCLFILKQGTAAVESGPAAEPTVLNTLVELGESFGEMSLIDLLPHSAHVRSRGHSEVLALSKHQLVPFFADHPDAQTAMILNIARVLSLRLRQADRRFLQVSAGSTPARDAPDST